MIIDVDLEIDVDIRIGSDIDIEMDVDVDVKVTSRHVNFLVFKAVVVIVENYQGILSNKTFSLSSSLLSS